MMRFDPNEVCKLLENNYGIFGKIHHRSTDPSGFSENNHSYLLKNVIIVIWPKLQGIIILARIHSDTV